MIDVTRFLLMGAWSGIRNTKKGKFARWVFGAKEWFDVGERTRSILVLTLGVVLSLIFLNAITAMLAGPKAIKTGPAWLVSPALLHDFSAMVLMFFAVAGGFLLLYLAAGRQRLRDPHPAGPLAVSRFGFLYFIATAACTILLAVATVVAAGYHRTPVKWFLPQAGPWLGVLFTAVTLLLTLFGFAVCVIAVARSRSTADALSALVFMGFAIFIVLLAGVRASAHGFEEGFPVPERSIFALASAIPSVLYVSAAIAWLANFWIGIWALLALFSWLVRGFLVQFAGDVAAYVTPNDLDRFDQIRTRIKERVFKAADAIYRASEKQMFVYDSVVILGHSLGSVCAYDALNRMLNEDAYVGGRLAVVRRTKGLVTFGSPLDKTAFIFETNVVEMSDTRPVLAATVQPLIANTATKTIPWKNVYSLWDIFAGELNYYSKPGDQTRIDNRIDYDAVTPVEAHTEYWKNREVWKCVDAVLPATA